MTKSGVVIFRSCRSAKPSGLPDRLKEGYGLNATGLEHLAARGVKVVVTVDCGINAREPARRATELGLDLIITDHHEVEPPLPAALAVVNPKIAGSAYPFPEIAGVGVAFKLVWGIGQQLSESDRVSDTFKDLLMEMLSLVAVGTDRKSVV